MFVIRINNCDTLHLAIHNNLKYWIQTGYNKNIILEEYKTWYNKSSYQITFSLKQARALIKIYKYIIIENRYEIKKKIKDSIKLAKICFI